MLLDQVPSLLHLRFGRPEGDAANPGAQLPTASTLGSVSAKTLPFASVVAAQAIAKWRAAKQHACTLMRIRFQCACYLNGTFAVRLHGLTTASDHTPASEH